MNRVNVGNVLMKPNYIDTEERGNTQRQKAKQGDGKTPGTAFAGDAQKNKLVCRERWKTKR